MRLKKLEISGFKSFAKSTVLEFPAPIVAIVGPNGSGKSNVSEAMRWVLGEQSMKSLRGKRGEDLIFHGSGGASQLGKAMVRITLDNKDRIFPLDFEEIAISREVYRDGANEYKVNGSVVRLKDIIELLSKVGIGGSGHHIISQGEADRILYASPRERRRMLEDALGLKIYEIKRQEAERKLSATEENMREVEVLRREIQPHLKFLKSQAEKVEASSVFRGELEEAYRSYLIKEATSVAEERAQVQTKEEPMRLVVERLEAEIERLRADRMQALSPDNNAVLEMQSVEAGITQLEAKRRSFERELGRIEGQLAFFTSRRDSDSLAAMHATVPLTDVANTLSSILAELEQGLAASGLEAMRTHMLELKRMTAAYLDRISRSDDTSAEPNENKTALEEEQKRLKELIQGLEEERKGFVAKKAELEASYASMRDAARGAETELRAKEEELGRAKDEMRMFATAYDRIRMRQDEYVKDRAEAERMFDAPIKEGAGEEVQRFQEGERDEMRRTIERLKIKIEEIGGIDASVVKEYMEVSERDMFLVSELEDLRRTAEGLRALMEELQLNLEKDFVEGISRINEEFLALFAVVFGGGRAGLVFQQAREEYSEGDVDDSEAGVEIEVDLPRKRVRSLDMLSGGERALTSIALLFAMSAVNPPPFLVLDETDAALDEANSQRYGAMLSRLSEKAQLVVITHNRQTMKEAGILYGVTMGSDGVSKLLSIKFEEAAGVAK